jgi:hypothetical protein
MRCSRTIPNKAGSSSTLAILTVAQQRTHILLLSIRRSYILAYQNACFSVPLYIVSLDTLSPYLLH